MKRFTRDIYDCRRSTYPCFLQEINNLRKVSLKLLFFNKNCSKFSSAGSSGWRTTDLRSYCGPRNYKLLATGLYSSKLDETSSKIDETFALKNKKNPELIWLRKTAPSTFPWITVQLNVAPRSFINALENRNKSNYFYTIEKWTPRHHSSQLLLMGACGQSLRTR